jgi:type VI protein secretion system component Hcp
MRIIKSLTGVVLRRTAVATLVAMAALSMSARPPIYMKYEGIKGQATPTADDSHKETIEIASWSFGASNPTATGGNRVQGNTAGTDPAGCTTGPFKFTLRGPIPSSLAALCQTRGPVNNVVLDVNGVKHQFQNATLSSCQTGPGASPTDHFTLNYSKCSYHGGARVAVGDVNGDGAAARPNARLIGLPSGPVPVSLQSLKFNPAGSSATMSLTKVGAGTLALAGANATPLPKLELVLSNGQKWTFLEVKLENVFVSSATGQSSIPTDQFSLNFAKVEGSMAGYGAR